MKGSLNLGKIAGIKLRIHWTFLILIVWVSWMHANMGYNFQEILMVLAFVMTIFVCIVLHELGHALVARKYNIDTKDITLLPIGGLARLEKMPDEPVQEFWIAIAGPLVNGVIAGLLSIVIGVTGTIPAEILEGKITSNNFLFHLMSVNIFLIVFNLIPAFPMDGGRIFRALLSLRINRIKATRIASSLAQVIAILFIFLGLFSNPFLILIGIVVYLGAQMETQLTEAKFVLSGYKVKDVMMGNISMLKENDPLSKAIETLLNEQSKEFLVISNNSENKEVVGILTRDDIIRGLADKGKGTSISSVMTKEFKILAPEMPMEEVYSIMQQNGSTLLPVITNNKLEGALDLENVMEFIMVQTAINGNKQ